MDYVKVLKLVYNQLHSFYNNSSDSTVCVSKKARPHKN